MKFLTLEQFTEMWKLQDQANSLAAGSGWQKQGLNWNLAIKGEVMELFDYIGWKWWKEPNKTKMPTDMQARLELVDIWHFILSKMVELGDSTSKTFESANETVQMYVEVSDTALKGYVQYLDTDESMASKMDRFCAALQFCDWTWDELYKAYIGKVALNNFRQANGYKEGTYQKIWFETYTNNGDVREQKEDNFFLEKAMELAAEEGVLTYERLYDLLQLGYNFRANQ